MIIFLTDSYVNRFIVEFNLTHCFCWEVICPSYYCPYVGNLLFSLLPDVFAIFFFFFSFPMVSLWCILFGVVFCYLSWLRFYGIFHELQLFNLPMIFSTVSVLKLFILNFDHYFLNSRIIIYFVFSYYLFKTNLLRYNSYNIIYPSKICSSLTFSIFTDLCNYHHHQNWNIFICTKRNVLPISTCSSFFPTLPSPRQPLYVFMSL